MRIQRVFMNETSSMLKNKHFFEKVDFINADSKLF